MLGFSRGAFIAKFLTNMICTVGLLCKGNTSMVPLAYRLYQDFVKSAATHRNCKMCPEPTKKKRRDSGYEGNDHESDHKRSKLCDYQQKKRRIDGFKETFCRMEYETDNTKLDDNKDIQVYFLGLWDCVNSVAVLQGNSILPQAESDLGEAKYVRHAVSIDENRVQFRAALFQQSYPGGHGINPENLQEVWFPGDHADVGGGWPANGAKFLTSDISLAWMIREMKLIDKNEGDSALQWYEKSISKFKARFDEGMDRVEKKKDLPRLHNTHNLWDAGLFMFIFWWIMGRLSCTPDVVNTNPTLECMPIAHWELERTRWVNSRWPNLAGTRDIPSHVFLHNSVKRRLVNDPQYRPSNNRGGNLPPCLRSENLLEAEKSVNLQYDDTDRFHRLWRLAHRS